MTTEAIPLEQDPVGGSARPAGFPPTAAQQELWMAAKVGGDDANRAFNGCFALTLRGELDGDLLAAAWQILTERHEALRCAFTSAIPAATLTSASADAGAVRRWGAGPAAAVTGAAAVISRNLGRSG